MKLGLEGEIKAVSDRLRETVVEVSEFFSVPTPFSCRLPVEEIRGALSEVQEQLEALGVLLEAAEKDGTGSEKGEEEAKGLNRVRHGEWKLGSEIRDVRECLESSRVAAASHRVLLLTGEAGVGKSHLLADVADRRLRHGRPTVLLLGQNVKSGNPWDSFLSELDLRQHAVDDFLGALDAAGQSSGERALLLIDAINEGAGRSAWRDRLRGFLEQVSRFPYVAVGFSCRSTYLDTVIPKDVDQASLPRVEHFGFRGHEAEAARVFLDRQGIERPATPLLSPEFSNPLFLKTACKALLAKGKTRFPKGLQGVSSLFRFYLEALEDRLAQRMDIDPHDGLGGKALMLLAGEMGDQLRASVPHDRARDLLKEVDQTMEWSKCLLFHLLQEGALTQDLEYTEGTTDGPKEVIRFSYQRFSDHFVASSFLDRNVASQEDLEPAAQDGGALHALVNHERVWSLRGVIEALSIQIPERFGRELIGLFIQRKEGGGPASEIEIPTGWVLWGALKRFGRELMGLFFSGRKDARPVSEIDTQTGWLLRDALPESIIWRASSACSAETLEWLNEFAGWRGEERLIEVLLRVSTDPSHPFNADLLHKNLMDWSLPERDARWTIPIHYQWGEESEEEPEGFARTLVDWAWDAKKETADPETIRLCMVTLAWFLTSSNRALRDQATKALSVLLTGNPEYILSLLDGFEGVDDPYVLERLYAAVYGASLQPSMPTEQLREVSLWVYENTFSEGEPFPHVLFRDYARGIIEVAAHVGVLDNAINLDHVRPPYCSPWPLEYVPAEELESSDKDAIRFSLTWGDFGRYIVGDRLDWTASTLQEEKPATYKDLIERFRGDLGTSGGDTRGFAELENSAAEVRRELEDFLRIPDGRTKKEAFDDLAQEFSATLPPELAPSFIPVVADAMTMIDSHQSEIALLDSSSLRRWIWRRVHELGWRPELFGHFDDTVSQWRFGRTEHRTERIGKKYQWIAYHEALARMADNVHFMNRDDYPPVVGRYEGPWQIGVRDVDPSLLVRREEDWDDRGSDLAVWWRPAANPLLDWGQGDGERFLKEVPFPDFGSLLEVVDPNGSQWLVLSGFTSWRNREEEGEKGKTLFDLWYRIQSFLVHRDDLDAAVSAIRGTDRRDYYELGASFHGYFFAGEYPWHPSVPLHWFDWTDPETDSPHREVPVQFLVPAAAREWSSSYDKSSPHNVELRLPNPFLIEREGMRWLGGSSAAYEDPLRNPAFINPAVLEPGPSAALIRKESLRALLEKEDLLLVWSIGGEKGFYGRWGEDFFGRRVLSGVFFWDGEDVEGGVVEKEEGMQG